MVAKITTAKNQSMKFYDDRQKELNELDRIRNVAFSVNSQKTIKQQLVTTAAFGL